MPWLRTVAYRDAGNGFCTRRLALKEGVLCAEEKEKEKEDAQQTRLYCSPRLPLIHRKLASLTSGLIVRGETEAASVLTH